MLLIALNYGKSIAQEFNRTTSKLVITDEFEKVNLNDKAIADKVLFCQDDVHAYQNASLPESVLSRLSFGTKDDYYAGQYKSCLLSFSITAALNKKSNETFVLSIINPILRYVDAFVVNEQEQVIAHDKLGLLDVRPDEPGYKSRQTLAFDVTKNKTYQVFVYIRNLSSPTMLIDLYQKDHFEIYHQIELIFWGASIALLLGGALYNTFIYLISRSGSYIWYLIFYAVAFVYFSAFHGFGQLIWPSEIQD